MSGPEESWLRLPEASRRAALCGWGSVGGERGATRGSLSVQRSAVRVLCHWQRAVWEGNDNCSRAAPCVSLCCSVLLYKVKSYNNDCFCGRWVEFPATCLDTHANPKSPWLLPTPAPCREPAVCKWRDVYIFCCLIIVYRPTLTTRQCSLLIKSQLLNGPE